MTKNIDEIHSLEDLHKTSDGTYSLMVNCLWWQIRENDDGRWFVELSEDKLSPITQKLIAGWHPIFDATFEDPHHIITLIKLLHDTKRVERITSDEYKAYHSPTS